MPKAIYEGIYREIRSRIINGTYAFQEMLPTEAELTAEFGCTRNTVRRALSMLADGMFVQPIHGKGVRVIWLKGETDRLSRLASLQSATMPLHRRTLSLSNIWFAPSNSLVTWALRWARS